LRRPFDATSARIALRNAFWDLLSFFGTHVLAIKRQWALPADKTTFLFARREKQHDWAPWQPEAVFFGSQVQGVGDKTNGQFRGRRPTDLLLVRLMRLCVAASLVVRSRSDIGTLEALYDGSSVETTSGEMDDGSGGRRWSRARPMVIVQ
jgi:hypothetical protein